MNIARNKTAAITIALFLTISMVASMMTMVPNVTAHTPPYTLPTEAYIVALPDPIGVGQTTIIYMWLNRVYGYPNVGDPASLGIAYAAVNNQYRFRNYQLTITAPDNTSTTKTFDIIRDTTSSQSYRFTPDQVGTYRLSFYFPGQAYNASGGDYLAGSVVVNDYYPPASANITLTVQQNPISQYSSAPLPTEYWTRPIYGQNTEWWTISSNWLGTGYPGSPAIMGYGGFTVSYNLGGNGAVFFAGDTVGSQTSHIMWTKPMDDGGIVGGNKFQIQGNAWFEGSAYNMRYPNPIIMGGKIFYTEPISFTGATSGPTDCVDLRTGQLIWSNPTIPPLSFGYIYDHEDPNQHGVFPAILVASVTYPTPMWRLFDADTGVPLFNVTGVPSGASVAGPQGEILRYVITNLGTPSSPNYVLAEWNSSKLWNYAYNPYTTGSLLSPSIINQTALGAVTISLGVPSTSKVTDPTLQALITAIPPPAVGTTGTLSNSTPAASTSIYVPSGSTLIVNGGVLNSSDPQNRYDWNYSISWRNTMTTPLTVIGAIPGDILLCENGTLPSQGATFMGTLGFNPYTYFAVNLNASRGTIGSVLWWNTLQPPANNLTVLLGGIDPVNRVFVEDLRESQQWVGYNLDTGAYMWGPTTPQANMDYYGSQASGSLANAFAYGKMYSSAMAGIVYCYDTKTGNLLWTYGNGGAGNSTDSGLEVPGHYPTFVSAIGNGVVYTISSEHTIEMPMYKGALARAINATDGTEIWALSSYTTEFTTTSYAAADGYNTWFNSYDNSIYTVGRGPTTLTVSAPETGLPFGTSVVIRGTVMDTSAGTTLDQQSADFPNGVPCASDASMKDWMGYVYQQMPLPTNFTGVPVTIDVLDSNGNYRNIGSATTDATGTYHFTWTPDIPGDFTVIATFHGTNGYWPSYSETAFNVMQAPAATATPTPTPLSVADMYFIPGVAIIIVVIVIIGALIMLMLRKRPIRP